MKLIEGNLVLLKNGFIALVDKINKNKVRLIQVDNNVRHNVTIEEAILMIDNG